MLYAINQVQCTTNRALPRSVNRPKGKEKIQLHILQGLPGVGSVRAQNLLEAFQSVDNVTSAKLNALKKVSGIGHRLAERIRWAVSETE